MNNLQPTSSRETLRAHCLRGPPIWTHQTLCLSLHGVVASSTKLRLMGTIGTAVSLRTYRAVGTAWTVSIESRRARNLNSIVTCMATFTGLAPDGIVSVDKVLAWRAATQEILEVRCGELSRRQADISCWTSLAGH